ncbi:hypothetical protein ANCDUO_11090 [Ancylostoma duodenale]|uniref:ShKT domain-containing protein n=1 Tax=Ancylostoma duodenale TaxID=51022 RepID=A0A0C2GII1_9BILA|nr:hypothetical protein ANCDUO_11090 [Ancylostoma duodenale]
MTLTRRGNFKSLTMSTIKFSRRWTKANHPVRPNSKEMGCEDADPKCPEWANEGECTSNAVW